MEPTTKRRIAAVPVAHRQRERYIQLTHDWLVSVQWLKRLNTLNAENEIESLSFPSDETFESEWNFFVEHRAHPARIRIALALLSPRDQCLRADVKLSLVTTHGGKSIKEVQLNDHMFFLGKGDSTCSYINDRISPKVVLDLESDSYHEIMSTMREGNSSRTEDYTILANVRFLNEFEIQPRGKMIEFTRRFNADWKLNKFQRIIEEISQTRPPFTNDRRFFSESFRFSHTKIGDMVKMKKWKVLIKSVNDSSENYSNVLGFTLKSDAMRNNFGKVEIICKNDKNVLRRFSADFEDLSDNFTVEFYSLEQLVQHIYVYRQDFSEFHGRFLTTEYLLFSIQIVQPLFNQEIFKSVQRLIEPTVFSLNSKTKVRSALKSPTKIRRAASVLRRDDEFPTVFDRNEWKRTLGNAEKRSTSQQNSARLWEENSEVSTFSNRKVFPKISPTRLQAKTTASNLRDNSIKTPRSNLSKNNEPSSLPSRLKPIENSFPPIVEDLNENFDFLTLLFRQGLHSDVKIVNHERQWNLHKSILSTRSNYFRELFDKSDSDKIDLSSEKDFVSSQILDRVFLFLYTNQYVSCVGSPNKNLTNFETIHAIFQAALKFSVDSLVLLCLQDLCHPQNVTIFSSPLILICLHQATVDPFENLHSNEYKIQIDRFKQSILRFIENHSREILLSSQWKQLEQNYPTLVHDVLQFVVFQKLVQ